MDSLLPSWRDSMLVVTSWGDSIGPVTGLTLDSASARIMTGVPALLVIDSTGSVRHSVSGGLPMMIRVLNFVRFPAPAESLLYIKTDTTDQQSANRARAAILNAGHRLR